MFTYFFIPVSFQENKETLCLLIIDTLGKEESGSLTAHTNMFNILEGCCLNKKTQTDGPFKYLIPPIILEVGKSNNWQ